MPDGYLISVGVKADFSEFKEESRQGAEAIQEMAAEITAAMSDASAAADASTESLASMAEAYAQIEAQGIQTVDVMNRLAQATAEQSAADADAEAAAVAAELATADTTESMSAAALAAGRLNAAYEAMAAATLLAANSQNRVSDVLRQYRAGALAAGLATNLLSAELKENAAATAQLAAAKVEAIAAQTMLTEAEERAAAATAENAAATTKGAAADAEEGAAAAEDAVAVDALASAHGGLVSEVQAASAAIRVFEGALPIRAVERFSVTMLGLGPILQAAFPIVGAVALGEVIGQVTKGAEKFVEEAQYLSRVTGSDWMTGAIGQMMGLKEAVEQADEELLKLAQDGDSMNRQQRSLDIERIRLIQGPAAAYRAQGDDAGQAASKDEAMQHVVGDALQQARKQLNDPLELDRVGSVGIAKEQENIKVLAAQFDSLGKSISLAREQQQNFYMEGDKAQEKEDKPVKGPAASNKGDEERMRTDEVAFNQLRMSHTLTLKEEAQFWQERLDSYGAKTAEYATITGKLAEIYTKGAEDAHKAIEAEKKLQAQIANEKPPSTEGIDKFFKDQDEDITRTGERWKDYNAEVARGMQIQSENSAHLAEARIAFQLTTGEISKQAAAHQLAAIHAKEYHDRLEELKKELDDIKNDPNLTEVQKQTQGQAIQNRMSQMQGQAGVTDTQDAAKGAEAFAKPWLKTFDTITNGWMSVQDRILKGQISLSRGAQQMGSQMLLAVVHSYEQMAINALRRDIQQAASHAAMERMKTASTYEGTSERNAAEASSNIKSVVGSAKAGAASAYKAMAGIPIIGPELGAIAAAATFAGIMAFGGSFEQGGIIPGSIGSAVPILGHAREGVLTTGETRDFQTLVRNSGGNAKGSNGTTNHFGGNTFNGVADKKTFAKMLGQHERTLAKTTKKAIRNGRI